MVDIEDGYTKIANELLEAIIAYPFSKRQLKVVFFIARKTYGYGKKMDDLTITQIARNTGIDKAHVSRDVALLATLKVINKTQGKYGYNLGINKHINQWVAKTATSVAETATQNRCRNSNNPLPKQQQPVAETANTKENPKRKPQKKTRTKIYLPKDFALTDKMRGYAVERNIDPNAEFECFCDWHRSHATKHADWEATWRTWVRKAVDFGRTKKKARDPFAGAI